MKRFLPFLALASVFAGGCARAQDMVALPQTVPNPASARLRAGVPQLVWKGNMTALSVAGSAFGVLWGKDGPNFSPVVAAGQFQNSRAFVVGANLWLSAGGLKEQPNEYLLLNALAFLAGEGRDAKTLKIGVLNAPDLPGILAGRVYNARQVEASELADLDILVLGGGAPLSPAETSQIAAFLARASFDFRDRQPH